MQQAQPIRQASSGERPGMRGASRGSLTKSRARNLSAFLRIIAQVVFVIFLLSCLAASFPFRLADPLWYLKIGQVSVDFSVTLLFSLVLALLARFFSFQAAKPSGQKKTIQRFVLTALIIYSLLIPVQVIGYGVHWYKTGRQNNSVIRNAENQFAVLVKQIRAASSEEQLLAILGTSQPAQPSMAKPLSLAQQKSNVIKELEAPLFQLRARLYDERQEHLLTLGVGTAKGVFGASMLTFAFSRMKRLLG
ncbi:MAG: hypothetical protein VKP70_10635 [Cyanobacteriota bacterium]|nr:hypothetical protein [Cyanobacteriota bacterium]